MKNVKIPELVHKELKIFCANTGERMDDLSGYAIIKELKNRRHKFVDPKAAMIKPNQHNKK